MFMDCDNIKFESWDAVTDDLHNSGIGLTYSFEIIGNIHEGNLLTGGR
jgi:hypothetical protein